MSITTPTMPSTTASTTHPLDGAWPNEPNPDTTTNVRNNANSANLPLNNLDLWLEQTTTNNPNPSPAPTDVNTPSNPLADMIASSDPNLSLDLKTDLEQQLAAVTSTDVNPALNSNPAPNPFPSAQYASNTQTPLARVNKKQRALQQQPASPETEPTLNASSTNAQWPMTSGEIMQASSATKRADSHSPSPAPSHSDSGSHSHSHSHTAHAVAGPSSSHGSEEDPMAAINALAAHCSAHDGLSAVERAKRSAEEFTMSQLAKRKRKATSPPVLNSLSDEEAEDAQGGAERQSHRKYQKRLQKNRDSAFVSRIRRREYTRILENSLSSVEKEKDAALAAFREMKRRFDVVSAELAGIKTAAASNFAGIRDAIVNRVYVPDVPSGIFVPPPGVGFHPGMRHPHPAKYPPQHGSMYQQPITMKEGRPITTMYMVAAMVVGLLVSSKSSASSWIIGQGNSVAGFDSTHNATEEALFTQTNSTQEENADSTHGRMWTRLDHLKSDGYIAQPDSSLGVAQRVITSVEQDAIDRLGEETATQIINIVYRHLQSLNANEVEDIEREMEQDVNYTGFEALVRAVIRDDGGQVEEEGGLDQIIKQVNDINFEDRI